MDTCNYCGYLKSVDPHRLIFEGMYWQVVLSPDQQYLGKAFVTLKRHAESLKDLKQQEILELGEIFKRLENALDNVFKPTHYNWSCLMNDSVGSGERCHVHWHAIPRYNTERQVTGVSFIDHRWPKSARDMVPHTPGPAVLADIAAKIKHGF